MRCDFEEICKNAYAGVPVDLYQELPDKYSFLQMKQVYKDFRDGKMIKDAAEREKNKVKGEYDSFWNEYEEMKRICKEYNDNRITSGGLQIEMEKCKDKDKMLEILIKIAAIHFHDDSIIKRNMEKFK